MRHLALLIIFLCSQMVYGQKNKPDPGVLKKANEEVIFGFKLKNSNKIAVLCQDKNDKYLVYRFGTTGKVELSYPAILDTSSWKAFVYKGYSRGGGKQNAAMSDATLTFTNNGVEYELYFNWSSEEEYKKDFVHMGVNVTVNGKTTTLKGDADHQYGGALDNLNALSDLIHNTAWD